MNPPRVYDDTMPTAHKTSSTTNSVQSIVGLLLSTFLVKLFERIEGPLDALETQRASIWPSRVSRELASDVAMWPSRASTFFKEPPRSGTRLVLPSSVPTPLARAPTLVSGISLDRLTGKGPAEKPASRRSRRRTGWAPHPSLPAARFARWSCGTLEVTWSSRRRTFVASTIQSRAWR